ncbi:MAG: ACT domain-containing protein [Chloroflexota bacterium]|nr:ACT domain-containing protein [Chloroflexota bacterium]
MIAYIVELEDRPGELARIAEAIAGRGINIVSGAGVGLGGPGAVGLLTNDEEGTRSALDQAGCSYRQTQIVPISLPDRPGALADAARRLADAGVNVDLLIPTRIGGEGNVTVGIGVQDVEKARSALGELATASTGRI